MNCQSAIILAGGYGTRLRPLTFTMPKPMVPFLNAPMISYQIKALKSVGVNIIVLSVSRLAHCDQLMAYTDVLERELGIKILYAIEDMPLDTGGACIEAFRSLKRYWTENGVSQYQQSRRVILSFADVYCSNFQLAYTSLSCPVDDNVLKNDVLMLATTVADPSRYGVLLTEAPSDHSEPLRIRSFIEKPKTWCGNLINAGVFSIPTIMLEELCQSHPKATPLSLERRIFVDWVKSGQLCCMPLPKDVFWIDLGKPGDYLDATMHMVKHSAQEEDCLAENNVIGADSVIAKNARVKESIIMDGVTIGEACSIKRSIIGPNVRVPDNSEWIEKVAALNTKRELVVQSIEK